MSETKIKAQRRAPIKNCSMICRAPAAKIAAVRCQAILAPGVFVSLRLRDIPSAVRMLAKFGWFRDGQGRPGCGDPVSAIVWNSLEYGQVQEDGLVFLSWLEITT